MKNVTAMISTGKNARTVTRRVINKRSDRRNKYITKKSKSKRKRIM